MPPTDFNLGEFSGFAAARESRLRSSVGLSAAVAAAPVFIEVGGAGSEANITRDGGRIPSVALNTSVISDLIGSISIQPKLKVIRQSVEFGRAVERGATIDLVLAPAGGLPGRIIDGIHPGLADLQLGQMFTEFVNPNPAVSRILRAKTDPTTLTAAERETVAGALTQGGVSVDPADAADFASAFAGLQAAQLFGG
jgi:hypothetical protein